jgi:peroxiredoxin Q/BCP
MEPKRPVRQGDPAPDFTLPCQSGHSFHLADHIGHHPVVLYFYPKDNTPGCTIEARTFRDRYPDFQKIGAEVVGISADSVDAHDRFAATCELPFLLASDHGGSVRRLYGVPSVMGLLASRVTYVIDAQGTVIGIISSVPPAQHPAAAYSLLVAPEKADRT